MSAHTRYRLIGYRVHPKTGERVDEENIVLCPGPFTNKEAMTAKSKFTPRHNFAIVPQEIGVVARVKRFRRGSGL